SRRRSTPARAKAAPAIPTKRRSRNARRQATRAADNPAKARIRPIFRASTPRLNSALHTPRRAPQTAISNKAGASSATRSNSTARDWLLGRVVDTASSVESTGCGQPVVRHSLTQGLLVDLARGAQRDVVHEDHIVRHPPFGDLALQEVEMFLLVLDLALLELDQQHRSLVPFGVRRADDGRQGDLGVTDGDVLDVDGADPLPARLDDVLGA